MTSKVYKSAQGQMVDMGALALKNENTLAVSPGGGKVNARGDRLDANNNIVDSKTAQVKRQIADQTQQIATASNQRVHSSTRAVKAELAEKTAAAKVVAATPAVVEEVVETETIVGLDTPVTAQETVAEETSNDGLAAAIARAKNKKAKQ